MIEIPIELIEAIERGNCVLFLGWADSEVDEARAPQVISERVLAERLAKRVGFPEAVGPLHEVAEYFEVQRGPQALIQYLCEVIEQHSPPRYYSAVIELPFNIIVSTSLDNFLTRMLQDQGKEFVQVTRDEELPFIDDDRLLVVKLYGDVDSKASIVVTEEHHLAFFDQLPSISDLLKYYFSTKTLLFIGYSLDDRHFRQLYAYANQRTKGYQRRAFAVKPNASAYEKRRGERMNLAILDISPEDFLARIADSISIDRPPPKNTVVRPIDKEGIPRRIHKSPYKFLSSYEEQDTDIFFGRDDDTKHAIQRLLSSKLMILYGKSGFGKTSLLCAGIIPYLVASGYLPVYARCAGDPSHSIRINTVDRIRQLDGTTTQEVMTQLESAINLPLPDFVRELKRVEERPLVVFVDQFEEFFISLGDITRERFGEELAACVDSPYIDATFLLCLREDFLPELYELRRIFNIFENQYRLAGLTGEAAKKAITEPAKKFGRTFGNGLVKVITQELSGRGQVDPAQLQIVCDRLYNDLPDTETEISIALYEKLGGVGQILADYVDYTLDKLGPKRRQIAQRLLQDMVTSSFTRIGLSLSDAVAETEDTPDWSDQDTRQLLSDLVRMRLIRRAATVEEESYELTHEYLIRKIREWMDLEELRVKAAQDLLRQEYNNWEHHEIPMDRPALEIIDAQREQLRLNNKLKAFIMATAVRNDFEFEYWITRNRDNQKASELLLRLVREGTPNAKGLAGIALALLDSESDILNEIYAVYESVANPNTPRRIEELQSQGFSFVERFLEDVREIVEDRFTKNMVMVEEGEFLMGTSEEQIDVIVEANDVPHVWFEGQYPQRRVYVDAFYIDKFLVTNAEFQEFEPTHTFPPGHEDHPATGITWYEAQEYAKWVGKELPTEEEWEKAARGTDGRTFPWGDDWDPTRCSTRLSGYGGTTRVDQFPAGVSPHGCYDMSGNVWEWTTTWKEEEKTARVLKGSSWSKYGILPWCWYRFDYEPDSGYSNVGFRCVKRASSQDDECDQSDSADQADGPEGKR